MGRSGEEAGKRWGWGGKESNRNREGAELGKGLEWDVGQGRGRGGVRVDPGGTSIHWCQEKLTPMRVCAMEVSQCQCETLPLCIPQLMCNEFPTFNNPVNAVPSN